MKLLDLVRTANRNLSRSKLRTFLTISAIFVGAFTLTLTTALGAGAQQYLDRQLGNVTAPGMFYVTPKAESNPFGSSGDAQEYDPNKSVGASQFTATLTQSDVDKLGKLGGVENAKPYYTINGSYLTRGASAKKYVASGLTQYNGLSLDLSAGSLLKDSDQNKIILPDNYVGSLGFADAQDAIGKTVTVGYKNLQQQVVERQVTVAGVMKKSFVTQGDIYIDDHLVKEIAQAQGQDLRFLAVMVKFSDGNAASEPNQKKELTDAGSYSAISLKEQIKTITTIVSAITVALNVVGVIALFAASFGIINTLLMSVYERTQEVGLMKALGMRRLKVFSLFAVEAVLVGFWGSVIAVGAGYGVSKVVTQWASTSFLKDFQGFDLLVVTPMNALFVILLIMLIAFLAGTLPALKASRLNPIEALRSE
jgi:putative ABC transport system permease protein